MIKSLSKEDVDVEWTGTYPARCFGEWVISIKGLRLASIGRENFNTFGEYGTWYFKDWLEEWESYKDGLKKNKWIEFIIEENHNNLHSSLKKSNIEPNEQVLGILFDAIQEEDWRSNGCGGCI